MASSSLRIHCVDHANAATFDHFNNSESRFEHSKITCKRNATLSEALKCNMIVLLDLLHINRTSEPKHCIMIPTSFCCDFCFFSSCFWFCSLLFTAKSANEIWWSTFSILFVVAPYLVSYSATGSMLQKKSDFVSLLVMTPLLFIYFMILDIVFMVYAALSSIVFLFTCSKNDIDDCMEEHFFHAIFGVSRMELIDCKRLRMLSQLLPESFPSLILQIRIPHVINNDDSNNYSETYKSLYFLIRFALIHAFKEGCILYLAEACQCANVCVNARLSWLPFANILTLKSVSRICFKNNYSYISDVREYTKLNFEQIVSSLGCVKYKLDYEFADDSWQILIKHINSMGSHCQFKPVNSHIKYSINYKTTNTNVNANTLIALLLTASSDAFSINWTK